MADLNSSSSSAAIAAAVLSSGGSESLGWLNDILKQLWPNVCVAGEQIIKESVEPALAEGLPKPFKGIKFSKIDFGTSPPKFDNIDVFTRSEDSIKLNIDVDWTAEDCEIELANSIISAGVGSVQLKGRLSVLMSPLINTLPCIGAVQLAFINPPTIDIDFTGIADVANRSSIDQKFKEIVESSLASMMILPTRMLTTLAAGNDFCHTYKEPIGIVRLTVVKGSNFRSELGLFKKDIPDIYVQTKFGAFELWETSVQKNSNDPAWNERKDFIFSDDDQEIKITAYDYDKMSSADLVGSASTTVGKFLLEDDGYQTLKLVADGVKIGPDITLQAEIYKCVPDLLSFELPDFACGDTNSCICGYMIILVGQGFDIPGPTTSANTYVKVEWGPDYNYVTSSIADAPGVDATNPAYDTPFLIPLTQQSITQNKYHDVVFILMKINNGDDNDDGSEIGRISVSYDSVVEESTKTITADKEGQPIGDDGAKLRYQVSVRGLSK